MTEEKTWQQIPASEVKAGDTVCLIAFHNLTSLMDYLDSGKHDVVCEAVRDAFRDDGASFWTLIAIELRFRNGEVHRVRYRNMVWVLR